MPVITAAYFGPGVKLKWYQVYGSTPYDIVDSIKKRGPTTTGGQVEAEGLTEDSYNYQFVFQSNLQGGCQIVTTGSPAVDITIAVTLPHWNRPSGVSNETLVWAANDLMRVAIHEKVHVSNALSAETQANQVLAKSTCYNAEANLDRVWLQLNTKDCQFDMNEYGKEDGLTMSDCLAGRW